MTSPVSEKPKRLYLYIDDTGSRHPDRSADQTRIGRDWFALGGFLAKEEDEEIIKNRYRTFIEQWPQIQHPLHITDILAEKKGFAWLGRVYDEKREEFWSQYKRFLSSIPVAGTACVIDRPGYVARGYGSREGDAKWLLCRSAFDILVDRSCKIARYYGRKLSIEFEKTDPDTDNRIKEYYKSLKTNGLAFDPSTSHRYAPLTKEEFSETLYSIEPKPKKSRMMQIADSYVYLISRGKYDRKFHIYRKMIESGKLIDSQIPGELSRTWGIKYYCFTPLRTHAVETAKPGNDPRL